MRTGRTLQADADAAERTRTGDGWHGSHLDDSVHRDDTDLPLDPVQESAGDDACDDRRPMTARWSGHLPARSLATSAAKVLLDLPAPSRPRLGALLSCVGFGWYEGRATGRRKGEGCGGQAGEEVLMGVVARC